jgi:hypothetical protein
MSRALNDIATAGRLFPDAAIDQIRGNHFVLWHEGRAQLVSAASYGGRNYIPAALSPSLQHALHLPAGIQDFGSLEDLIGDLSKSVTACDAGLDQHATLLVATGIAVTWVSDCVPCSLVINLWGDVGVESTLLDFMGCVCRRALCLVEPSPRELASLPTGFTPSLIVRRPGERSLRRLVVATAEPNSCVLSGGDLVHMACPIVVSTSNPVNLPALPIPLPPATHAMRRITKLEAQGLVDRFQPRLLHYRLKQHLSVAKSEFDAPGFCPEVRMLARVLGAAVEGSPSLQAGITDALRGLDEQRRGERSQTTAAVVLEALLALSHRKAPAAYVGSICDLANDFLENREDPTQLSPKAVGELLRQQLGLVAHRRASGYELTLDVDTQQRLHRLAVAHDVLQRVADCPRCQEMVGAIPTQNQSTSGV